MGRFDNIVISPGPGRPEVGKDVGISLDALQEEDTPIFGREGGKDGHLTLIAHDRIPI